LPEIIFDKVLRSSSGALLSKILYGLRQAPILWSSKFAEIMAAGGFERCTSDPCIFGKSFEDSLIIVAVYVDNILLATPSEEAKQHAVHILKSSLGIKDLGKPTEIIGWQFEEYDGYYLIH
jgi:Reverse transcriptase (RNA-dependent DNA polymerase)